MDFARAVEFILDQQVRAAEAHRKLEEQQVILSEKLNGLADQMHKSEEQHSLEMARLDSYLRRAVRLGVREARAARRRTDLDLKITQLAAAQVVTEELLQNYLKSRGPANNGKGPQNP